MFVTYSHLRELTPREVLALSWIMLCIAVALHVTDEALTGFLSVYNPTVLGIREKVPWIALPVFSFRLWLGGLIAGVTAVFLATFPVARGNRAARRVAVLLAMIMLGNGFGHILGTIMGRTIGSVHFPRPMPGSYSSPLLVAASINLLVNLRKSKNPAARPC